MVASIAFNSSSFHAEGILALLETAGIWIFQYNQRQGFRSNKENADLSLKDIGNMINKVVQGWINYYTQNAEEARLLEANYSISSKQYVENGIHMKVLSKGKPNENCVLDNDITLEDAYIYLTNS